MVNFPLDVLAKVRCTRGWEYLRQKVPRPVHDKADTLAAA